MRVLQDAAAHSHHHRPMAAQQNLKGNLISFPEKGSQQLGVIAGKLVADHSPPQVGKQRLYAIARHGRPRTAQALSLFTHETAWGASMNSVFFLTVPRYTATSKREDDSAACH